MEEKVLKMYRAALRDFFVSDMDREYSYIVACSFKRVLLEAFGMKEEELKEIEAAERPRPK